MDKQVSTAIAKLESKLVPHGPGISRYLTLPKEGWSSEQVRAELGKLGDMDHTRWEDGFVSGAVYHGGNDLLALQAEAFERFGVANPIHPDVFPGVRKMEAEVVAMVWLFFLEYMELRAGSNGDSRYWRCSMHHRDLLGLLQAEVLSPFLWPVYPHDRRPTSNEVSLSQRCMYSFPFLLTRVTQLNQQSLHRIIPSTAHAAFYKAASYFNIKLHLAPCLSPTYRGSIPAIRRLINPNTILLVGSVPNYPHGIVDDIPALSRLALSHKLLLHVDCCLGSFLMPFLSRAGFPSPYEDEGGFDFRLQGVTSISVDTHKYGFAPKGNSVCLYRNKALRSYQYFIQPDWSGGIYGSPSMAGSRPGALIAGCWASLMSQGESGYVDSCHRIVGAAKTIEAAIREHPVLSSELDIIGEPLVSVVAFTTSDSANATGAIDVYDIADAMSGKGWHLNALQSPPAIHVAVTIPIVSAVEKLINDLLDVVVAEREKIEEKKREGKVVEKKRGDASALYGVAGSLPDKTVVSRLAEGFLDTLYVA